MARPRTLVRAVLAGLALAALAAVEEDAASTGCLAKSPAACATCHPGDAQARWNNHQHRACSPYCQTCHGKATMAQHHNVGTLLTRNPGPELPLSHDNRVACGTCHLLSRPRYDSVRWKAASLYDRLISSETRHKTYFLSIRNDKGQLCLACH